MITSKGNPQLKTLRKLMSSSRERRMSGLFVVEGVRLFCEVPKELLQEIWLTEAGYEALKAELEGMKNVQLVSDEVMKSCSDTVNPQGVIAVVKKPRTGVDINKKGKILLLDGIKDPGNMGTIIRTAEAAGVKAVYVSADCVDVFNPKVIRSTMGSIFRVPVITADLLKLTDDLKNRNIPVYACSLDAEKYIDEVDMTDPAIIIGSEAAGIKKELQDAASLKVKIKMYGQVESLNAAIAAAVMMFR